MMKLILMNVMILFIIKSEVSYFFIQISVMIYMMMYLIKILSLNVSLMSIYYMFMLDSLSYMLVLLSIWVIFMVILASLFNLNNNLFNKKFMFYLIMLMLVLILFFFSSSVFILYLFFELSLIPMFLLILGWGGQFDRLEAGFYMFIYTFALSLPLLIFIMYMEFSCLLMSLFLGVNKISVNSYIYMFLVMAFLVKMPIYLLHLWLPKAHVEASVGGSMILAGVMLKLGSYGFMRVMLLFMYVFNMYIIFMVLVSLMGSLLTSLICLRQMDMKILVAYSSVVHMGVLLSGLATMKVLGLMGSLIMMISHGLCSSGMFSLVNIVYERLSSRSMLLNKGLMLLFPSMSLMWFLLMANNMSSPPSLSLFAEYFLLISLLSYSYMVMLLMILVMFFSACYVIYLYAFTQYGILSLSVYFIKMIYVREYILSLMHLIPLNFMFLKLLSFY